MSTDFTHANAGPFELEAGESAILLIHGFTGAPGHMRFIGNAVYEAGFSARGILLPGHGSTLEDMEKSDDAQWWDACRAAYNEMIAKYRRVAVAGLSMGGILALLLAEQFDPAALILFAPALRYKKATNHLSPVVKHFMRRLDWGENHYDAETFLREYDFGYSAAPVRKVEDMTRLQRRARENLAKVDCPTLVMQSHKDESVHRMVPSLIASGISSQVKEISWVDRSPHVLTIGPDREYVCDRVIDFLRRFGV